MSPLEKALSKVMVAMHHLISGKWHSLVKKRNYFYYLFIFLKGAGLNENCCIQKTSSLSRMFITQFFIEKKIRPWIDFDSWELEAQGKFEKECKKTYKTLIVFFTNERGDLMDSTSNSYRVIYKEWDDLFSWFVH